MSSTIRGTVRGLARRANPAFATGVVAVAIAALTAVSLGVSVVHHTYVHVMAAVLWTGIDVFMALVLGPVLGGLSVEARAGVFERFTPKMTFLMPSLAAVTIGAGITLAQRLGVFPHAQPWIALFVLATTLPTLFLLGWQFDAFDDPRWWLAFAVALLGGGAYLATVASAFGMTSPAILVTLALVVALTVLGFGVLLPGEVRIYLQLASRNPDSAVISRIGMRNARLSGLQGLLQLGIVAVMVALRWGGL